MKTQLFKFSLVDRNLLEQLVLVEVVHHVHLLVVVGRQDAVKNGVHECLLALVAVLSNALGVDNCQVVARRLQIRLILIEQNLKIKMFICVINNRSLCSSPSNYNISTSSPGARRR